MTERIAAPASLPSQHHLPSLDGLRGIAVLLVLLHNFDVLALTGPRVLGAVLVKEFFYVGWIGVQLFFVLSGYLITRGLLQTQDQPGYFSRFFLKRVLRIFPLYYASLLLFLIVLPATGLIPDRPTLHSPLWMWFYMSNWTTPSEPTGGPMPHFWSLAVEEQFYLLWPLLLWKLRLRQVWWLSLALTALSPVLRLAMHHQGLIEPVDESVYEFTFCRMDALTAGAALAAWDQGRGAHGRTRWRAGHLGLLGFGLLLLTAWASHGFRRIGATPQVVGYSLLALTFTAWTGWAVLTDQARQRGGRVSRWSAVLRWPVLRLFGQYSYAIYVFHKPLHDLVGVPLLTHWTGQAQTSDVTTALVYFAAATAVTFGVGWLSWHTFERHFMRLKDRLSRPAPDTRRPSRAVRGTFTAAQRRNFREPKAELQAALRAHRGQRVPRH